MSAENVTWRDGMGSILIVDDEAEMRLAIKEALTRKGYSVELAPDGREAMRKMNESPFDMVISDLKMPGMGGMELLKSIKKTAPRTPVLLITAFGTIQKAVEAVKEGAVDFILKPFTLDALESTVEKALMLREGPRPDVAGGKPMVSSDPSMKKVISMALTAAASDATVLISGESGTGKELFARLIHANSPRADRPFVAVNCASIPDGLLESELFGHEKGAFTGAIAARQGKFEQADTGTILLDEISEMDTRLQAKLLRIIQEKEVERLGGKNPIPLDIRIIATTNREMKKEVAAGRFREDLFYRLNIFPLLLPPLRERGGDIVQIANYFMNKFAAKYSRRVESMSNDVLGHIKKNRWRGNIREMENTIERAVLLSQGQTLELEHLVMGQDNAEPEIIEKDEALCVEPVSEKVANEKANNMTLHEMEKGLICKTLDDVEGNRTRAAKVLGISVRTLRNKLKEYGQVLPG